MRFRDCEMTEQKPIGDYVQKGTSEPKRLWPSLATKYLGRKIAANLQIEIIIKWLKVVKIIFTGFQIFCEVY